MDFFDIKGDVETLLALTGVAADFAIEPVSHPALHPGQSAKITRGGELVGYMGLLDPRAQQALDVSRPVYLFEISLAGLADRKIPAAHPLSRFPEVRRDIAVIVDRSVSASAIRECTENAAGEALTNLKLFDVYEGKGIDPTGKSLALGLTFQHPSRTLTDDEISQSIDAIVAALARDLGASLRN